MQTQETIIDTNQLAKMLGVTTETINRYRKDKGLPFIALTPRTIRYEVEKVKAWLETRTIANSR